MSERDYRTPFCFFLVSVAYTVGWTAISSMLAYYKQLYGPQILLQLNTAYFLPSIPVLLLQTQCDACINRSLGIAAATACRLFIGLGGSAIICALYPFYALSVPYLLWVTAFLGVFSGIAFGSSYQLVAYFEPINTVALTTGYVGSGPIVLLLELFLQVGPDPSTGQIVALFELVAGFTIAGACPATLRERNLAVRSGTLQRERSAVHMNGQIIMTSAGFAALPALLALLPGPEGWDCLPNPTDAAQAEHLAQHISKGLMFQDGFSDLLSSHVLGTQCKAA